MPPSPKFHWMVWVSLVPTSVKLPLNCRDAPALPDLSVPALTDGATLLTVMVNVSRFVVVSLSVTRRVAVSLKSSVHVLDVVGVVEVLS